MPDPKFFDGQWFRIQDGGQTVAELSTYDDGTHHCDLAVRESVSGEVNRNPNNDTGALLLFNV